MRKVGDATDSVPTGWTLEARMNATAWLGIDIAKDTFEASLLQDSRVAHGGFDNTPAGFKKLEHWLKKRHVAQAHVCLEADRKSTRLNSSHANISYAVFC